MDSFCEFFCVRPYTGRCVGVCAGITNAIPNFADLI